MGFLGTFLLTNKIKSQIKYVIRAIYSEDFDFEKILRKFSNRDNKLESLQIYVVIQIATKVTQPISQEDIQKALIEVDSCKKHLNDISEFEEILFLQKELAEISWLEKTNEILEGKLAFSQNKFSYEGTIYEMESINKGPIPIAQKEKMRALTNEISDSEKKYDALLHNKSVIDPNEE